MVFFFNFEGLVFYENKYDKGILNFPPLMCKSADIPLRGVLSNGQTSYILYMYAIAILNEF